MQNWLTGILDSFTKPLTNGFIEGCNNKIKVLKRNAYGYRDFNRFRNRILHMFSLKSAKNTPDFLRAQSTAVSALDACFHLPADGESFVLRPDVDRRTALLRTLDALEAEEQSTAYGHDLLSRAQMLQLLVMLGRGLNDDGSSYAPSEHCNEKTAAILEYLNTHLTEDISIDALADTFYLSKYYMMRLFRAETGFTIHGYLTDKRLRVARDLIARGMRTTDACYQCGYHDYSAFSRAYKKRFQVSPRADQTKGAQ